jgi:hypothetical protein
MGGSHHPPESTEQPQQKQHPLADTSPIIGNQNPSTCTITTAADSSPPGRFVSPWAARSKTGWHRYIRTPLTQTLRPVGIVDKRTAGRVQNEEALLECGEDGGDGVMVLERRFGEEAPAVVVDFGLNAVGTVEFDFAWSELFEEEDSDDDEDDDDDGGDDDDSDHGDGGRDGDEGDLQVDSEGQYRKKEKKKKKKKKKPEKRNKHTRPGIRLAFSESLEFLSERSDFTRSDNVSGCSSCFPHGARYNIQHGSYTTSSMASSCIYRVTPRSPALLYYISYCISYR